MAHKKGAGSSDNGRDSKSKRLGVKLFGGQRAVAGNIIIRQRGTQFHAGENVYMGRDHTLHAKIDGVVVFKRSFKDRRFVSIEPYVEVLETPVKSTKKATAPKQEVAATPAAKPAKKAAVAVEEVADLPAVALAEEGTESEAVLPAVALAEEGTEAEAGTVAVLPAVALAEEEAEAPAEKKAAAPKKAAPAEKSAAPEKAAAPKKEPASAKASADKKGPKLDDLKIIEGVGPKIETLLKEGGISTWAELAAASEDRLKEILEAAGPRYQIHDPSTWPAQAKFAAEGKWEELKEYQEMLTGGRDKSE